MALGGAWVQATTTQGLPPEVVILTGRTFAALADAAIIGLNGDSGADTGAQLPATFPGTAGDGQGVPTAAQMFSRVDVTVVDTTDPTSGAGNGATSFFVTVGNSAPWRVTITLGGSNAPTTPVSPRVKIQYFPR